MASDLATKSYVDNGKRTKYVLSQTMPSSMPVGTIWLKIVKPLTWSDVDAFGYTFANIDALNLTWADADEGGW